MEENRMRTLISVLATLLLIFAAGCGGDAEETPETKAEEAIEQETTPPPADQPAAAGITMAAGDTVTTESGLKYVDITVGEGASPTTGQMCEMHYTGWLLNGTKFDSSRDRGQTFQFPIGTGRVIKGWDEGVGSMKVGGQRMLIIPYELAYGEGGRPPVIPPKSPLIFDVELIGAK